MSTFEEMMGKLHIKVNMCFVLLQLYISFPFFCLVLFCWSLDVLVAIWILDCTVLSSSSSCLPPYFISLIYLNWSDVTICTLHFVSPYKTWFLIMLHSALYYFYDFLGFLCLGVASLVTLSTHRVIASYDKLHFGKYSVLHTWGIILANRCAIYKMTS